MLLCGFSQDMMLDFYGVLEKSMSHMLKVPEISPMIGLCNQMRNNVDVYGYFGNKHFL